MSKGTGVYIEVTTEMVEDIRKAKWYEGDESFTIHCGVDLINAVEEAFKKEGREL